MFSPKNTHETLSKNNNAAEVNMKTQELQQTYELSQETAFTKSDIDTTTILLGNLSTAANRLLEAAMENLGYNALALPHANLDAFHLGREFSNKGQCNPVYFTVGNLLAYLEDLHYTHGWTREYIAEHYAFITAGSCGPCRFGLYESEYRLALESAGYKNFRVILFQQSLSQQSRDTGLNFGFNFFLTLIEAVMLADHLTETRYRLEPYEKNSGEVEAAFQTSLRMLVAHYHRHKRVNPFVGNDSLFFAFVSKVFKVQTKKILKQIDRLFSEIDLVFDRVVPVVKITGEFWAQTTEGDGNFEMFSFLKSEGAEILVEPISGWLSYLLWLEVKLRREKRYTDKNGKLIPLKKPLAWINSRLAWFFSATELRLANSLFVWRYKRLGKLMGNFTRPLVSMDTLASYSKAFMDSRYDGGEGHLEVAKNIYYSQNGLAHMVLSVKPFGCMPSTISDSVQSKVTERFPSINFLAVETSSEGKINAYSRVQMQLTQARTKAKGEIQLELENLKNKKGFHRDFHRDFYKKKKFKNTFKAKELKKVFRAANLPAGKLARTIKNGIYIPKEL